MHLHYFISIKGRHEIAITSPISNHDPSIEDTEYAEYMKENVKRRIQKAITDGQAFQIQDWIFNPKEIDYVIVKISEE